MGKKILKIGLIVLAVVLVAVGGFVGSKVMAFNESMAKVYDTPLPKIAAADATPVQKLGGGALGDVQQVCSGASDSCARQSDGKVWCWGRGRQNETGYPVSENQPAPRKVSGIGADYALGHGMLALCAAKGADVLCWGNGTKAMLATGAASAPPAASQPIQSSYFNDALSIVGGDRAFCVLRFAGEVWCWGQRGWVQTGEEGVSSVSQPTPYGELVPK